MIPKFIAFHPSCGGWNVNNNRIEVLKDEKVEFFKGFMQYNGQYDISGILTVTVMCLNSKSVGVGDVLELD